MSACTRAQTEPTQGKNKLLKRWEMESSCTESLKFKHVCPWYFPLGKPMNILCYVLLVRTQSRVTQGTESCQQKGGGDRDKSRKRMCLFYRNSNSQAPQDPPPQVNLQLITILRSPTGGVFHHCFKHTIYALAC